MASARDRVLAVAASGVLFYFGTGMSPVPALTWLAPLPVLLLASRVPAWTAAGAGFLAYLAGTANAWEFQLRSHDTPMWPVGLVINVGMSLVFALAVWGFHWQAVRGRVLLAALTAPALWTGTVCLVSVANPMGIMGTLANDLGDVPLVLQTAAVTGMWGVEFLVLLAPATIAAVLAPRALGSGLAARVWTGVVAVGLLGAALGAGAVRLAESGGPVQRVAAISTNQRMWAPDLATPAGRDLVAAYAERIAALPAGVRAVVLPEGSFGAHEARPAALFDPMRRLAKDRALDIVVGHMRWDGATKYNYAALFPADGGEPVSYLKHHNPAGVSGTELLLRDRAGVVICGDVNHSAPVSEYAAAGAGLLLAPAADEVDNGWQHSRMMVIRGVEHGQATVWAARTGTLTIADGYGRVLAEARTDRPEPFATVVAELPTGPGGTLYTRFGDWFGWLCLVLGVGGLFLRVRRGD
ncbi:acyltransferase [Crossiella sp. SN42]|uniref:nitrilase-related carbon-nitrogen hydrolase n=1 Tax=Crossiella sp. SN42 TaxID=2944808 RepID=UPI00207D342A|nr:nitrilase-related carbon-nitrogen hydrolase [Crossiella sp. SN42]MCO1582540.1 acyltransferase [Crossiella sp. SN42]